MPMIVKSPKTPHSSHIIVNQRPRVRCSLNSIVHVAVQLKYYVFGANASYITMYTVSETKTAINNNNNLNAKDDMHFNCIHISSKF